MDFRSLCVACTAALMASAPAFAADPLSCAVPGVTVVTDPAGDELGDPAASFADILSLSLAEPASADGKGRLVFTYKMSGLSTLPPDTLWVVRFTTEEPAANGDAEFFVAMLTGPDATPHFVYGSAGPADGPGGVAPNLFTPHGALDALSNFKADGTITLVLDKSKITGLNVGQGVTGMIPLTHRITPTDGTLPFAYGFRSLTAAPKPLAYDDTAAVDEYLLVGSAACPGKSGTDIFAAGALTPAPLLLLLLGALTRRRTSTRSV